MSACLLYRKGVGLIFPNPDAEICIPSLGCRCSNANEPGDVGRSSGKSSLFFVRNGIPGIGLSGDRDVVTVKHRASCGARCTSVDP